METEVNMRPISKQPSDSVTGLFFPEGVDDAFRKKLQVKYGISVAGGQEQFKGKVMRISHLGYVDPIETIGLIAAFEYTLIDCGVDVQLGSGVTAAVQVLKDWE